MSFSGLTSYLMCPQKFKYSNIDKVTSEFTPLALAYGSAVHDALEVYYNALTASGEQLPTTTLLNILKNGLEDEAIKWDGVEKDKLLIKSEKLLTDAVAMPVGTIIGTEVPVEIKVANDFSIIGRIDLLTEENGETIITDFKTAARKPSQVDVDGNLQLTTYSVAYPNSSQRIRALIKSKTPQVVDLATTRTDIDRQRVMRMFMGVKEAIEAGAFYPHESWACAGCQFYKRCHKEF